MSENRPTLLWGYDESTGRISALPASPMLLPAVLLLGAVKLASVFYRPKTKTAPLPDGFNLQEYQANKKEYRRLFEKIKRGQELTPYEQLRWSALPYPSWSKGERWHY